MAKPTIIPVSFKDNIEDRILLEWLNDRFEEYEDSETENNTKNADKRFVLFGMKKEAK